MKDLDALTKELEQAVNQHDHPVQRLRVLLTLMERADNQGMEAQAFYWSAVLGFTIPNIEACGADAVAVFNLALATHRGNKKAQSAGLS